ncbi:type IV secretory system conjugative DNA transfer family protein [Kordia sp.]|uniref:type IV secretory system conjugative DNA transfer family protein n=1 Tax=Kordia sp. TaxID=1965332 RepID=UPI003D2E7728
MNLSLSEQRTLDFYQWEYRYRGYYHFEAPVDIEIPYIPFGYTQNVAPVIDDGRVPSLFKRIGKFFESEQKEVAEVAEPDTLARLIEAEAIPNIIGFVLSFPKGNEVHPLKNIEFLSMLSSTAYPMSFEIHGTVDTINIQIVCSTFDSERLESQIRAYFPNIITKKIDIESFGFDTLCDIAIADFGLNDEFMRPIAQADSYSIDPLTSIIATLDSLRADDVAVVQILFKGITSPLAKDIPYSVSDGSGGSFFADAPEMLTCAKMKTSYPLFSVVMRIATQGRSNERSQYLAQELARSISNVSRSEFNMLIPLSNEGYNYDFHVFNLHERLSNRLGFILNAKELSTFIHYPNKSVVSAKLGHGNNKTKLLPKEVIQQKYVLGINEHNGEQEYVSINDDIFSKHIVAGGATGTGKSHLLKQLIRQDIAFKNSAFVLDPHGDLVHDILELIPEDKQDDVVYINLADQDYSFGFNIFSTETDAEKTVLASDLATAFADTWISSGDRIQSVLQKTISTFIYSEKEASILDMKRFLLEQNFRAEFLQSLDDQILLYYWNNEFPLVRRNDLSPLLLRIDIFMQTRLLRNIFCQTRGINFRELVEERKLVLIQLSVGLIGLQNSIFLAHLIISKINQIAFSRQSFAQHERFPIHLYIDESHNYANTPVIEQILSGARKYNLSLVLTLQHLEQVPNNLLNSILSNTATQIFFRQSDKDSKKIAPSFSFFEAEDFMELDRGEAIVRVHKRSNDFNMRTLGIQTVQSNPSVLSHIIQYSREKYSKSKEHIKELLATLLPQQKTSIKKEVVVKEEVVTKPAVIKEVKPKVEPKEKESFDTEAYIKKEEEQEVLRKHRSLQEYIKTMAQQRGFVARIEEEIKNVGRVDVGLTQNDIRIAVEVSVTNSINYEVKNIEKCLSADYDLVFLVSESEMHRNNIQKRAKKAITAKSFRKTFYMHPNELSTHLDALTEKEKKSTTKVKGWRVNVNYHPNDSSKQKKDSIRNKVINAIKKKK